MDFENFEGFKRIKNTKNLTVDDVYELLKKYEDKIGELQKEDNAIKIKSIEKYFIEVRVLTDEIIIEVKLDSNSDENVKVNIEEAKNDLELVRINRTIEQIYDLLNDYIKNGVVKEHITATKEILHMVEKENLVLGGVFSLGQRFEVTNESNELIYEAKDSRIGKLFSLKNNRTRREDVAIKYENYLNDMFTILKQPFERIEIKKDSNNVKSIFKGKVVTKELKVSGDYTDNHFLVELDEVVIGAIDCLDPETKKEYSLEINDSQYEYIIVCLAIILDIFALKNGEGIE